MLLEEVLQLDPDRVWREEPPRCTPIRGRRREIKVLYLVDERWLATWRQWAFWSPPKPSDGVPETKGGDPELPPSPPGPLSTSRLKSDGLKLGSDYRAIGPSLYAYLVLCHGGGGRQAAARAGAVDLYALPAEQAPCVAASVVAAFVSRRARLRRKPAPPPSRRRRRGSRRTSPTPTRRRASGTASAGTGLRRDGRAADAVAASWGASRPRPTRATRSGRDGGLVDDIPADGVVAIYLSFLP